MRHEYLVPQPLAVGETYICVRRSSSSASLLLLLRRHAFREKRVDAVLLAPLVVLPHFFQGVRVIARFQFGFETVG
jgi:hypothetical protein